MNAHAYTEDQLVEQPAIQLFAELGWETLSAADEVLGELPSPPTSPASGSHLGRETKPRSGAGAIEPGSTTRSNHLRRG